MNAKTVVVGEVGTGRSFALSASGGVSPAALGAPVEGYVNRYRTGVCAVFTSSGGVWLQVGGSRWSLDDVHAVRQTHDGVLSARYRLSFRDERPPVAIRLAFPLRTVLRRIFDPLHDEITSWDEDVMKALPYVTEDGEVPAQNVCMWVDWCLLAWPAAWARSVNE